MMDVNGDAYSPLTVCDFEAYRLPIRQIREHCNSNWPWGCRLGPRFSRPTHDKPEVRTTFGSGSSPARDYPNFWESGPGGVPGVDEHGRLFGVLGYGVPILGCRLGPL